MSHIFISYSHKDKEYVHKLQVALVERGIHAWIDDRIDYGSKWPDEIEKRLQECSAFVLVMTPNAKKSHWVQNELHSAIDLHKPIFSLLLNGDIWWSVKTTQTADVKDGNLPKETFFQSLIYIQTKANTQKNAEMSIHITGDVNNSTVIAGNGNVLKDKTLKTLNLPIDPPYQTRNISPRQQPPKITRNWKIKIIMITVGVIISVGIINLPIWAGLLLKNIPTANITPILTNSTTANPISHLTSSILFTPTVLLKSTDTNLLEPQSYKAEVLQKGIAMLLIPAGTFTMGNNNGQDDEKPEHTVSLSSFYMDMYEVTNVSYKACVEDKICSAPIKNNSYTHASYYENSQFDNYPVIYVDWRQAKTYCEWRNARLPTEAEWEYAARGADGRSYPWGEGIDKTRANYEYNKNSGDTSPVNKFEAGKSPFGVYNMAGNVGEWVNDWYDPTYYKISPSTNPLGPSSGQDRVVRGGAWNYTNNSARSTFRFNIIPSYTNYFFGFRCAMTP